MLRRAAISKNIPFDMLRVGSARNRINPDTGMPEFDIDAEDEDSEGSNDGADFSSDVPVQTPSSDAEDPETITARCER